MSYTTDAYSWARLTTGTDTTSLPDASLALLITGAEQDLCLAFPCTSSNGKTTTLTDATDLSNFAEALGVEMGLRFMRTPAGHNLINRATSIKIGPITETTAKDDYIEAEQSLTAEAMTAMYRIACVMAAQTVTNNQQLDGASVGYTSQFQLYGRRRKVDARIW